MGFGSIGLGAGPFGASYLPYNLLSATAVSAYAVDLLFDRDDLTVDAELIDKLNYTFSGSIVATGVVQLTSDSVRVYTTQQEDGEVYTVTVDQAVSAGGGEYLLEVDSASFTGLSTTTVYSVSGLAARSHCAGRRIDLFWENPTDPPAVWTKIVRRQKNWVFDLTDAHDVVYEGPNIEQFFDTGVVAPIAELASPIAVGASTFTTITAVYSIGDFVRISQTQGGLSYEVKEVVGTAGAIVTVDSPFEYAYSTSATQIGKNSPLRAQAFYYYTVLVSDFASPPDTEYDFTDDNHVAGLSIAVMDSKEKFFWKNTPEIMRVRDSAAATADGVSGNGLLDAYYEIYGCWLNLLRGHMMAVKLLNSTDETPYYTLSAKNQALGIDPEGFSYDFEIPRRTLTALANVYKRRGTCEGLVRAASMFTKWDSECAEFSLNSCAAGSTPLSTWDGTSLLERGDGDSSTVTSENRLLIDTGEAFTVDEWQNGFVVGSLGDRACVVSNTATALTLSPTVPARYLTGAASAGSTTIPMTSTGGLQAGLRLQVESTLTPATSEIVEILSINAGVSIELAEPLVNSYVSGDFVSLKKSLLRTEVLGSGGVWSTVSGTTRELTYANGSWTLNQWAGSKVLASDNTLHTILSNTDTTLRVDSALLPADGDFSIAYDFTLGASFVDRDPVLSYTVYNGSHTFLFDPTLDLELRGTRYDPFSPLWMGPGSTILGAWGPGDVALYITTDVALHIGLATTASGNMLTIDPAAGAVGVNDLAGQYLNPNQNQRQLFRILSNTATTITVDQDIASLVVAGQAYYVLNPRDASRYTQLTSRLGPPSREFSHQDIDVRVLFA